MPNVTTVVLKNITERNEKQLKDERPDSQLQQLQRSEYNWEKANTAKRQATWQPTVAVTGRNTIQKDSSNAGKRQTTLQPTVTVTESEYNWKSSNASKRQAARQPTATVTGRNTIEKVQMQVKDERPDS